MTVEKYWFWLCNIEGIWTGKINILISFFRTPEEIYKADSKQLSSIKGLTSKNITDIIQSRELKKINKKYDYMKKKSIKFIYRTCDLFPNKLLHIENPPYALYVKGNLDILTKDQFAVAAIGARNSSSYGNHIAKKLGFEMAALGVTVISGMARGIDSYAHIGALDAGGNTIAVLGCGVDVCYPRENIELYEKIVDSGLIISEYPCKSQPTAWQFPLRNRIISGLADKIIVVEAREKSGSLITVEYALMQGKDVMAVPGRLNDELSKGCNRLIREGAGIVTCTKDVLADCVFNDDLNNNKLFLKKNIVLEKELESVYSYVDLFPKNIQTISNESGISPEQLIGLLIQLQMLDLIEEPAKNHYSKK